MICDSILVHSFLVLYFLFRCMLVLFSKNGLFSHPPLFDAPARDKALTFVDETYPAKIIRMGLTYSENFVILTSTVFG